MVDFEETDDLARLKRWWAENGAGLMVGILLGLIVVAGWYGWQWYKNREATQAAATYAKIVQGLNTDKLASGVVQAVARLKSDYASTPYAGAAAMALAKYRIAHRDLDKAQKQLSWVVKNGRDAGIRSLARVRKARVIWDSGHPNKAIDLLDSDPAPGFESLYAETRGDILSAQHKDKAAHAAYEKAMTTRGDFAPKGLLKSRLDDSSAASHAARAAGADDGNAS